MNTVLTILILLGAGALILYMISSGVSDFRNPHKESNRFGEAGRIVGFEGGGEVRYSYIRPELSGELNDLLVKVWTESSGDEGAHIVVYEIAYPSYDAPPFNIQNKTLLSNLGLKRHEMPEFAGTTTLGKAVVINGIDHIAISRYLTPTRQDAVRSLLGEWKRINVTHGSVKVHAAGKVPKDPNEIASNINRLVELAEILRTSNTLAE